MKWKQSLLWLVLLLGIGLLSYPLISKVFNDHSSAAAIAQFRQCLMETDTATERALAETYNLGLLHTGAGEGDYEKILNISQGIMGYLKIPKIHVSLPIYHGTRQEVLGKGVGHLPESALPIGGRGNHTVLTGHTGLPSARLLTDLSQLEEGICS